MLLPLSLVFTAPSKDFIFDRQNGLLTYPRWFWQKPETKPFKDIRFDVTSTNKGGRMICIPHTYVKGNFWIPMRNYFIHDDRAYFGIFVWYMDKNRPLPPGEAFDPYRIKDYDRRVKELGFNNPRTKPLYDGDPEVPVHTYRKAYSDYIEKNGVTVGYEPNLGQD